MKNARAYLFSGLFIVVVTVAALSFSQRAEAQISTGTRPVVITQKSASNDVALGSIDSKLNKLLQSQGGRYVFLVSDGELVRLDTQQGKIAIFNIVQGASWDTLEIPERSIGPGNAFYEKYVQFLEKTDFNTN